LFEYRLEKLTTHKQEQDFEEFARLLAQKEICPNIIPQTGPVGGGDSKTDAATYPVDSELELRWNRGNPKTKSGTEDWKFAFSAKQDWKPKLKSDIAKIAALQPKPDAAFFITSQFVKDKERGELESELTQKHNLRVKILDRNWIVEATLQHGHERLAIDTLGIDAPRIGEPVVGPRDAAKRADLKKLEEALENPDPDLTNYALAEMYLEAATLSREIEQPRSSTEALLLRARDLADKSGNQAQRLRVAYAEAWTFFWWFDDPTPLLDVYARIEAWLPQLLDTEQVDLLSNLWMILSTAARSGGVPLEKARVEERLPALLAHLDKLAADDIRPNNALHSRALAAVLRIASGRGDTKAVTAGFASLKECLEKARQYTFYPAQQYVDLVVELGDVAGDLPGYDDVFAVASELSAEREGEVRQGQMLLQRGFQLLRNGQDDDALGKLSRAKELLSKRESAVLSARASLACAVAYDRLGLFWAARMEVLTALNIGVSLLASGDVPPVAAEAALRLAWLELELGRLPQTLSAHNQAAILVGALKQQGLDTSSMEEELRVQDAVLGLLILRTEIDDLQDLTRFPMGLRALGMLRSELALRFALGDTGYVTEELKGVTQGGEAIHEFFQKWLAQPAAEDLPARPIPHAGQRVTYETRILGVQFVATVDNEPRALATAESVLASFEAFFATATHREVFSYVPRVELRIRSTFMDAFPPRVSSKKLAGRYEIEIAIGPEINRKVSGAGTAVYRDWVMDLISTMMKETSISQDQEKAVEKLLQDHAAGRALLSTAITLATLDDATAGEALLDHWNADPPVQLSRDVPWATGLPAATKLVTLPTPPEGPPTGRQRHASKVINLVDIGLWNKAGWKGIAVTGSADDRLPPALVLIFSDITAGTQIFRDWREQLGTNDPRGLLRVAIIEGLDNGKAYAVHLGLDMESWAKDAEKEGAKGKEFVMSASRYMEMPAGSPTLPRLKAGLRNAGCFHLVPAKLVARMEDLRPDYSVAIEKTKIYFRKVEEIGDAKRDVDAIVLSEKGKKK
jgi:hypothetical protein